MRGKEGGGNFMISIPSNRYPWTDRWTKPAADQLLTPMKAHHRRQFDRLMNWLSEVDSQPSINWFGPSWKWTFQYDLPRSADSDSASVSGSRMKSSKAASLSYVDSYAAVTAALDASRLCYLVPSVELPLVSVPLDEPTIEILAKKRLSGFIKDGIRHAKCAVQIHWASWTPCSESEAMHLIDLLKRKVVFKLEGADSLAQAATV